MNCTKPLLISSGDSITDSVSNSGAVSVLINKHGLNVLTPTKAGTIGAGIVRRDMNSLNATTTTFKGNSFFRNRLK